MRWSEPSLNLRISISTSTRKSKNIETSKQTTMWNESRWRKLCVRQRNSNLVTWQRSMSFCQLYTNSLSSRRERQVCMRLVFLLWPIETRWSSVCLTKHSWKINHNGICKRLAMVRSFKWLFVKSKMFTILTFLSTCDREKEVFKSHLGSQTEEKQHSYRFKIWLKTEPLLQMTQFWKEPNQLTLGEAGIQEALCQQKGIKL